MLIGFTLSSLVFIFLGIFGGSKVKTLNQYILILPLFFAPAALPFLGFFGLWDHPVLYIIPTKASLLLFEGIYNNISTGELIYSISYLLMWSAFSFFLARRSLQKNWKY
jgi:fluoroquinolone transport system permease protein